MAIAGMLQLSLVSKKEWRRISARVDHARQRSLSMISLEGSPVELLKRCTSSSGVDKATAPTFPVLSSNKTKRKAE